MSCPEPERIAAAAADEDPRATAHADECARCAELLADQVELRELARGMAVPVLVAARREALAQRIARGSQPITQAELAVVLGKVRQPELGFAAKARLRAELLEDGDAAEGTGSLRLANRLIDGGRQHRGARVVIYASIAAAAAIVVVVAWSASRSSDAASENTARAAHGPAELAIAAMTRGSIVRTPTPPTPSDVVVATPAPHVTPSHPTPTHTTPADVRSQSHALAPTPTLTNSDPAAIVAIGADYTRTDNTIALRDGVIDIDARNHASVAVAVGATTFTVKDAHVELVAANGVIVSAHSFAGSIERSEGETRAVIADGDVWTPPAGPTTSLASFRAGWKALHDGRTAAALAAFDRATDPVVAEDAAFWAAVAAQRLDDREGAKRRFRAFLGTYPTSPRADSARRALAQLDI